MYRVSFILYTTILFQLVKDPTHNGNILDLVFVTSLDLGYDLKVGLPFSGHNSISMVLSRKSFPEGNRRSLTIDWDHVRISFTLHSMALCFYGY